MESPNKYFVYWISVLASAILHHNITRLFLVHVSDVRIGLMHVRRGFFFTKFVFGLILRQLTVWHYSHLLLSALLLQRPAAAAIGPYLLPRAHSNRPAAAVSRWDRQTDRGRTPFPYIDPAAYNASSASKLQHMTCVYNCAVCDHFSLCWQAFSKVK